MHYVRITRVYNIPSILLVFERTISCKLIVRSLTSGHTHNPTTNSSTEATNSGKAGIFVLCSAVQAVSIVQYSTLSNPHY